MTTTMHPALTQERPHAKFTPTLTVRLHLPQLVATAWQQVLACETNESDEYDKQRQGPTCLRGTCVALFSTSTQGVAKTAQKLAVPDSFHCCVLVLHLNEQVQEKESFTFTPQ
jgi:hypothetical protein